MVLVNGGVDTMQVVHLDILELNSGLVNGGVDIMQVVHLDILELNRGLDNGGIDIMQFRYPWVEQWFG